MSNDRPDPDSLLARVTAAEAAARRGRLKIFFGMAPGVGKTYAMLEAARKAAGEGVDLVVGYLEPHARPETYALLMGLDLLPCRIVDYRGKRIEEFDLEGTLARKPQVVVVDELAHSNAEGSIHPKRWQDVEDLLAAGISVYTTINVQHLESLNDVISQVTSIPVRETVPDRLFEDADEVELVDISPDDLITRLREGKVYVSEQAARALESFFRKGNLIALRELALRKTADRVGAEAVDYRQSHEVDRIWPTSDRLLVCVGPSPMSARLIRATRRMAASLRAPWIALHVELDTQHHLGPADQQRLDANLKLAEELGATVATIPGHSFAPTVIEYCRRQNITRIIAGKPLHSRWLDWWRGSLVTELIRESGDVDVYIISGETGEAANTARASAARPPLVWRSYLFSIVTVLICTLISTGLAPLFEPTNLAMVYLAGVVVVALISGRGPSILATVLGVAAFDMWFVAPFGTFVVGDSQYLLTFIIMMLTGLIISELTARVRSHSQRQWEREQRTVALYALSKELSSLPNRETVLEKSRRMIKQALDCDVWIIGREIALDPHSIEANTIELPASDIGVIRWVFENNRPAGRGTDTLPGTATTYLPLTSTSGVLGVLGVRPTAAAPLGLAQRDLLQAFVAQIVGALERCRLAELAEETRLQIQTERLRNSLLSTVSHDLRTPLATITGAASALAIQTSLNPDQRRDLAESIVDESDRLNRLVGNLLDLTRLEANAIELKKELQPIEEVIGVALSRMERATRDHHISLQIDDDLPPVAIDAMLMQQVLINLLENASKYSPVGSSIELKCWNEAASLIIEVSDRGSGLPPGEEVRIFEKFHRVEGQARSGSGVGLAICRGVVELHGGSITARNRVDGGTILHISLPLPVNSEISAIESELRTIRSNLT
jgi:two-component system sensor histidine kinase KdpD